jgi:hypothetical protein
MGRFETVFIVLDALDESDRDSRKDLLGWITRILGSGRSILVTSRDEHDIRSVLTTETVSQISIQSSKVDADVRLYVQNCLQRDPKLKRFPKDVKDVIENKLVSGSNGMYEAPTPFAVIRCSHYSIHLTGSAGWIVCYRYCRTA